MKDWVFQTEYAGHPVRYRFLVPGTMLRYRGWVRRAADEDCDISVTPVQLALAQERLAGEVQAQGLSPSSGMYSYAEFRLHTEMTSHVMIRHGCCFFHAVAFAWRGRAFLLTAPSGTGKTTQLLNWQHDYPDELSVICGDMPLLERRKDGSIWVWPSPWNGKENLGDRNHPPASLAGVVVLEQAPENTIVPLEPRQAIPALLHQMILLPDTEEEIRALSSLTDALLRNVPVWKLTNRGDAPSTALLRETLKGVLL